MNGPITIRKSLVGLFLIYLTGALLFALLFSAALLNGLMTRAPLGAICGIGALAVVLGTLIQGYVYRASYVQLTDDSIIVVNYSSLLVATTANTRYAEIQDVDFQKPGLLAMLFDAGTLIVNSASGAHLLTLRWLPDPEKWCAYILSRVKRAQSPSTAQ